MAKKIKQLKTKIVPAPKLKILSLGWGVQSWTIAAMCALGELPMVDYAIHSDTTWERKDTYDFAKKWTPWLIEHGVNVVTVVAKNTNPVRQYISEEEGEYEGCALPAFTISDTGSRGQVRRQCTTDWKIAPIRNFATSEIKRKKFKKTQGVVEKWLGISLDEWERAKDSQVKYIVHKYPLLDMNMTRQDCINWLIAHGLEVPPKSSCVFCPYHDQKTWKEIKLEQPEDWKTAIGVDHAIRKARPPFDLFVHHNRMPLELAVDLPEDYGLQQRSILDQECDSGHCFL